MDRASKIRLITNAFNNMENTFKHDPNVELQFDVLPRKDKGYDADTYTRVTQGAEYHFQQQWENELQREIENLRDPVRVDREIRPPLKLNSYHPRIKAKVADLVVSDFNLEIDKAALTYRTACWSDEAAQAKFELKQTGANLFRKPERWDHFFHEALRFSIDKSISEGECLYVFSCYFETDPTPLKKLIDDEGSLLKWIVNNRQDELDRLGANITEQFKRNCVETYAFRGVETDWITIDNSELF